MSIINERLFSIIGEKQISYGELSKLTGISKSALQRYAVGDTEKVPTERIEQIASALSINPAYIMGWTDSSSAGSSNSPPSFILTSQEKRLLGNFRSLSDQGREYVLQQVDMAMRVYKKYSGVPVLEGEA